MLDGLFFKWTNRPIYKTRKHKHFITCKNGVYDTSNLLETLDMEYVIPVTCWKV